MKLSIQTILADEVQMFKALGDEIRLKIVALLCHGELCVCDIMEVLSLPQSTASRHLAYLKNSQWVVGRRSGKWMHYKLHPDLEMKPVHTTIIRHISAIEELQYVQEKLKGYLDEKNSVKQCL